MSDTVKKWHEMQAEGENNETLAVHAPSKYIFLLDFNDGKVYKYDISALCNDKNKWNPDTDSCEAFLYGAGHKLASCEWMVTSEDNIKYGN